MKNFIRLRVSYIIVLISLIVLPTFANKAKHLWDENSTITYSTCRSYKCIERGRYVENSLDTSINPCNDFYQYACSGWIAKNPVPTTEMEYSIETYLKLITMKRLQHLLEQKDNPKDKEEIKVARKLYHECIKRHQLGRLDPKTIKFHLTKLGSWSMCSILSYVTEPNKSWIKTLKYHMEISNDMPLFDIYVGLDKNSEPIIQIEEVSTPFVMLDVIKWNPKKEQLYLKFLKQMMKNLQMYVPENCQIDENIEEIIHFRKKLEEVVEFTDTSQKSGTSVDEMTIQEFQNWYDDKITSLRSRANIPWLDLIRAAYPTINGVKIDRHTKINVKNKEYFELLSRLLDGTRIKIIVNHIQLYFAEAHMKMDSNLMKLLKDVILHDDTFFDDLIMDTDESVFPLHFCIQDHPLRETLANMYNEAYLSRETEKDVYALADEVKDMLALQIAESKWLNKAVKYETGQKLSRTNTFIGMADVSDGNIKRPLVNKPESPLTKVAPFVFPEAAYAIQGEYVSIGTGYLQPPVYEEHMPYVINYGSLGSLLGHEYFHSVQSVLSNKYHKRKRSSLHITSDMYVQKTKCFVDHYSHFDAKDLKDLPSKCYVRPNVVRSVDENVADTMGLKAAYEAYKKMLRKNNNICPRPRMKLELSCDQLFFISFALTFCGNIPSMEIRKILKRLTHLPPRIRVNGAVSNLQAFNEAFQCPKKAPLNSKKKCDIWE